MAPKLMKAVQYSSYCGGSAGLSHVELPIPVPKKDEILIKVESLTVNPADRKIQGGNLRPFLPPKFPFVPGCDVAGEVVSVGVGVDNFKPGDKVLSCLKLSQGGSFAEYAIAPVDRTAIRPPEVSALDASCLPVAGLTALQAIRDGAGLKLDGNCNKDVLITAASGGVGVYAVQIAKLAGAHVTATCGARNFELVRSLGADETLDYKSPEGKALQSPSGRKYDVVITIADPIPWATISPVLKPVAKVLDVTPNFQSVVTTAIRKLTMSKQQRFPFIMSANRKDLQLLASLLKEGKLKTIVDSQYPLARAEEAWAKSMEGHATGKIALHV